MSTQNTNAKIYLQHLKNENRTREQRTRYYLKKSRQSEPNNFYK